MIEPFRWNCARIFESNRTFFRIDRQLRKLFVLRWELSYCRRIYGRIFLDERRNFVLWSLINFHLSKCSLLSHLIRCRIENLSLWATLPCEFFDSNLRRPFFVIGGRNSRLWYYFYNKNISFNLYWFVWNNFLSPILSLAL